MAGEVSAERQSHTPAPLNLHCSQQKQEAARLRDALAAAAAADPGTALQAALAVAIAPEDYGAAAAARDALAALAPPPPPPPPPPTLAERVTAGVRVRVKSFFVAAQSSATRGVFTFAYRIRVVNEGPVPVQLRSRHWLITDGGGRVEEVRGPGVVGEQPILEPGAAYSYSSFCQLPTATGRMEGEYQFVELNTPAGGPGGGSGGGGAPGGGAAAGGPAAGSPPAPLEWGATFDVAIPAFGLDEKDGVPPSGWDAEPSA